jgi:enediyne biosynthesis protein E5
VSNNSAPARLPVHLFSRIDTDPRHWQIIALSGLFTFSFLTSDFGATPLTLLIAFSGAISAQTLGTLATNYFSTVFGAGQRAMLHGFEWKSALITTFGTTILLRGAEHWMWFAAAFTGIALKFLIRVRGKHVFNPANIGIVLVLIYAGRSAWVSPGQWGQAPLLAGYAIGIAALTLSSARRLDIAATFLGTFGAILIGRAMWLGDPITIPFHQLSTGSLLIFTFFMITDPRSTPDSRVGRMIFAAAVASLAAWYIIGPNQRAAPLMALALLSPLSPVIDWLIPAGRFQWVKAPRAFALPAFRSAPT